MKKLTILNFFITATFILASCKSNIAVLNERPAYEIPDSLLKTLKIDSVGICPLVNSLTLTGKVAFNEEKVSKIFPMVSGNITNVNAQLGDYVQKGQVLGVINSGEMAGYGNDLVSAKTNLLVAERNLNAALDMYKSGLMSQKDYANAEAMYKQAESQLVRASQVLKINGGSTQGQFVVRAPISGFIVEKQVTNNMSIRPDNTNNLFTISDLENVWVLANVYESNIDKIHLGDDVEVTTLSYPGRIFTGKVDKILNVLDPTNKVMKVRVVLPNSDYALKPEMYANVTVVSKNGQQALCIPSDALIFDNSRYYVLQFKTRADIKIIPVQVISTNGGKTYISGGLQTGDQVISSQTILIYDALNS